MANAQRERATKEKLLGKSRRTSNVDIDIETDDGPERFELSFRAISMTEYDKMLSQFPPTTQQKKDGATYNIDKFAPAIISATLVDPAMTVEEVKELWDSEAWNRGELSFLFGQALNVCNTGLSVDPTESASD